MTECKKFNGKEKANIGLKKNRCFQILNLDKYLLISAFLCCIVNQNDMTDINVKQVMNFVSLLKVNFQVDFSLTFIAVL